MTLYIHIKLKCLVFLCCILGDWNSVIEALHLALSVFEFNSIKYKIGATFSAQ